MLNRISVILSILAIMASVYAVFNVSGIDTDLFSPENVERVRQSVPKREYETPSMQSIPTVYLKQEINCLRKNIYFEARNRNISTQTGIAWVTLNRVQHPEWADSFCNVVYDAKLDSRGKPIRNRCQFSWYCDGLSDDPVLHNSIERRAWKQAGEIATTIVRYCYISFDPTRCPKDSTNGAVFFKQDYVIKQLTNRSTNVTVKHEDVVFYTLSE